MSSIRLFPGAANSSMGASRSSSRSSGGPRPRRKDVTTTVRAGCHSLEPKVKKPLEQFPVNTLSAVTRRSPEPQDLYFVSVTVKVLRGQHDAKQRKNVRAHVMKNFLKQSEHSSAPKGPSIEDDMTMHIGRFRSIGRGSHRGARAYGNTSSGQPSKFRSLKPLVENHTDRDEPEEEVEAIRLVNRVLAMPLPIEISTSNAGELLEYYHTRFWENSFAGNPEGIWLSIAVSDPAVLHATLSLVAQHRRASMTESDITPYYWHRGEAIKIISSRLSKADEATKDSTIAAVAILSNADNHGLWPANVQASHITGLASLVNLRGGLQAMSTPKQIKRVIGWADVLHAISHNESVLFETGSCARRIDLESFSRFANVEKSKTNDLAQLRLPVPIAQIVENVRLLSAAKLSLIQNRDTEACKTFSTLLDATERFVLQISQNMLSKWQDSTVDALWDMQSMIEAFRAAFAIFDFHDLRDLQPSAAFYQNPLQRLHQSLSEVICIAAEDSSHSFTEAEANATRDAAGNSPSLILWMLLQGWKATGHLSEERKWFTVSAGKLCLMHSIRSFDEFSTVLKVVVYSREHCPLAVRAFWRDVIA